MADDPFIVDDDPRDPEVRAAWEAVLGRLAHQLLPTELAGFVEAFAARQRSVVPAIAAFDDVAARHDANFPRIWKTLIEMGRAMTDLIGSLEDAGLGTPERPFGRFLSCDYTTLGELKPPWQIRAVRCLHRRLLRADVAPELHQEAERVLRTATAHHESYMLGKEIGPALDAAEIALKEELFEWQRMAGKLKWTASWYWKVDSPEYRAIFQMSLRPTA